jgi:predicted transcriptional regulator
LISDGEYFNREWEKERARLALRYWQQRARKLEQIPIQEIRFMYGDKEAKQKRLQALVAILAQAGWLTQANLARLLGVSRSTLYKDLLALHELGVLLAEDQAGRIGLMPDE